MISVMTISFSEETGAKFAAIFTPAVMEILGLSDIISPVHPTNSYPLRAIALTGISTLLKYFPVQTNPFNNSKETSSSINNRFT